MNGLPTNVHEYLDDAMRTLRSKLATINVLDLPSVRIDCEQFWQNLPASTSAVYFLVRERAQILYIGKATNLRSRWCFTGKQFFKKSAADVHDCFVPALDLGDVSLYFLAMPKEFISIVELLLIHEYSPPWNSRDQLPQ